MARPARPFFLRPRRGDAIAMVAGDQTICVASILLGANMIADIIDAERKNGTQPQDATVLLPSADPTLLFCGLIACAMSGCVAVPWREDGLAQDAMADIVSPNAILRRDGDRFQLEALPAPTAKIPRHGNLIMMTSGSTGTPKGVALDFSKVVLNATTAGAAMAVWHCDAWAIDLDMSLMSAISHLLMAWQFDLPLVHLKSLPVPAHSVLKPGFGYGGSPLQLVRLHEKLQGCGEPKMLASSGDFLTPAMIDELLARHPGTEIHKLYGLTELGGRFCHMPHGALLRNKTAAGAPLPGFAARVADPDADGLGEIEARTPLMAEGWHLPGGRFEEIGSPWLATGDVGRIDGEGVVTLVGRSDDVFKIGGEKVDRATIENALADLLGAYEYCVLRVEHKLIGQCAALFLVPASDRPAPGWAEIVAHLRQRVPNRFIPSFMYRLDDRLPRLPSGKLDRARLVREHERFPRLS